MVEERFLLAKERIQEIKNEKIFDSPQFEPVQKYFIKMAEFVSMVCDTYSFIKEGGLSSAPMEELKERNYRLYEDILPENYEHSYGNPAYAAECFGEELGKILCFLYAELRSMIPFVYERKLEEMVIRMELFLEVYTSFECEQQESGSVPPCKALQEILYWYVSDYTRQATDAKLKDMLCPESDFALRIIEGDL